MMRDYGFVVPGNPFDRITLPGAGAEGDGDQLPSLNGASLAAAVGFEGDWREGGLAPRPEVAEAAEAEGAEAQLALARRRWVIGGLGRCGNRVCLPSSSSSAQHARPSYGNGPHVGTWGTGPVWRPCWTFVVPLLHTEPAPPPAPAHYGNGTHNRHLNPAIARSAALSPLTLLSPARYY